MTPKAYSWLNPKLEIRDTAKYGRGVFAVESLKKGDVLVVMGGHILDTEQENEVGEFATDYNMDISEEWSFCPLQESDLLLMPQHLVNHSCDPNAGFSDQCMMVAIRDISPEEEIAYDYAAVMWSASTSSTHFEMRCECASPLCRQVVTENDWQIPELQQRYGMYFQPFLRRKFQNL
jgi:hypothetical protein